MYRLARPLLFRLDAEDAHGLGLAVGGVGERLPGVVRGLVGARPDAGLRQTVWGLDVGSPVGLAAGMDKNAERVALWAALGFGHVEVGSVTAEAAGGNPRPRAFRLPADGALVNRLGLGNDGAEAVARRLAVPRRPGVVVGVNVAKTHRQDPARAAELLGEAGVADVAQAARVLLPVADTLTVNVSCPNTADGKTFETPDALGALLAAVAAARDAHARASLRRVPLLVKLSPAPAAALTDADRAALDALVAVALAHGADGFVATNTASDRAGLRTDAARVAALGRGGLSGRPLAARAEATLRHLYRTTGGRVPLVGVGGIDSADVAYARIRAGASLVQLYTGLVYEGPGLVRRIARGLAERLERDGFGSVAEAVGADA